ncbi:unnamed protein product [Schistosoma margrebowiei]|uniref:Uncharacterized protein n=1 Tax=Schistosoma margrebowiei TaxID=48269 RepID=A0A183M5S4_9TREM|nr:unnamed protein product [Schistosoma margrebowiei]
MTSPSSTTTGAAFETSSSTTLTTQRSTSSEYKELTTQSKITLPASTIPVVHNRTNDQFTRIHSTTTSKPQIDYYLEIEEICDMVSNYILDICFMLFVLINWIYLYSVCSLLQDLYLVAFSSKTLHAIQFTNEFIKPVTCKWAMNFDFTCNDLNYLD